MRRAILALLNGAYYIKQHPHILFVLVFVVVIPVLFLYSGQQFLEVGRENQTTLQKERVGLMQDSFVVLLQANNYSIESAQKAITDIASLNPDITKFRITKREDGVFTPVAALTESAVGQSEEASDFYRTAAINGNESLIVEYYESGDRKWQVFRYVGESKGAEWFIFTELSLARVDTYFSQRENDAKLVLIPIFLLVLLLGWWQMRNTDFRYLYLEAQEANKTRDLFTNMITHELRAPLTAMRGYASMIEESKDVSYENREHANRMRQSAERLLAIVNDLLEVARIQSGRMQVDLGKVNVSELIQNVIFELKPSANAKSISLQHKGTEDKIEIFSDQKRLHQVMVNLISNAIKYTEKGSVTIELTDKRKTIEIRVKDTGMGISAEDQKKLFAPFFRVNSDSVNNITGTGLGMWITKQLIDILAGTVGVESIKDIGTNIVLTFKKEFPDKPTESAKLSTKSS